MQVETKPTAEQWGKWEKLQACIKELRSVAVAYSGGVDSTFLLYAAHDVLGEKAVALTVTSPFFPKREEEEAALFCENMGIEQICLSFAPLEVEGIASNPANRCYFCKRQIFLQIKQAAEKKGLSCVVEGSNEDDCEDYRPGMQAVEELAVMSPLKSCHLTKQDIRCLSRYLALPTWGKPPYACLASRFPYGEEISEEKLRMVEQAEQLLFDRGFTQFRVRIHGQIARIEVLPEDFGKLLEKSERETIVAGFRQYGFHYVALDMQGYRTGSMNELLEKKNESADRKV